MSVIIISFSGRRGGNCAQIAGYIKTLYGEDATVFDFAETQIHPCGGCNYECFRRGEECPWIGDGEYALLDAIVNSELAYFVIPNYCDYPCSNFFIFNERSQCYFQRRPEWLAVYEGVPKKGIIVSNTGRHNFVEVMEQQCGERPEMLFLRNLEFGKNSITGTLMTSPEARRRIAAFCGL